MLFEVSAILSTGDSNQIQIRNSLIQSSLCQKFLGAKFNLKLTFNQHVKTYEKNKCKIKSVSYGRFICSLVKEKLLMNFSFAT